MKWKKILAIIAFVLLFIVSIIAGYKLSVSIAACIQSSQNLKSAQDLLGQHKVSLIEMEQDNTSNRMLPEINRLYDFVVEFQEKTGCTVNKVIGKKITGSSYSTVASVASADEIHIFKDVDILEIVISTEDVRALCNTIKLLDYDVNRLTIYPTDGCVSVEFVVLGGVVSD